jgi:hypothetical protein
MQEYNESWLHEQLLMAGKEFSEASRLLDLDSNALQLQSAPSTSDETLSARPHTARQGEGLSSGATIPDVPPLKMQ